jgi:hypothetical protein
MRDQAYFFKLASGCALCVHTESQKKNSSPHSFSQTGISFGRAFQTLVLHSMLFQ